MLSLPIENIPALTTIAFATKHANDEFKGIPSPMRSAKRPQCFAQMGLPREELETLCHNLMAIVEQEWKEAHESIVYLEHTTLVQQYSDRQHCGLPLNPLRFQCEETNSKRELGSPSPSVTVSPKKFMQEREGEFSTWSEKIGGKNTYFSPLPRHEEICGVVNDLTIFFNPRTNETVESPNDIFDSPEYGIDCSWLGIALDELMTLDDELDVNYYGSGNWDIAEHIQARMTDTVLGMLMSDADDDVGNPNIARMQSADISEAGHSLGSGFDMDGVEREDEDTGTEITIGECEIPKIGETETKKAAETAAQLNIERFWDGESRAWQARKRYLVEGSMDWLEYKATHSPERFSAEVRKLKGEMTDMEWNAGLEEIDETFGSSVKHGGYGVDGTLGRHVVY